MPRLNQSVPKYRKHTASKQAFVELAGRRHYLGPHGTTASRLEYDRLIGEWLQNGRATRSHDDDAPSSLSVVELIVAYLNFAKAYYRKAGRPTSEYTAIVHALRQLKRLYGRKRVTDFGPIAMQAVMAQMVADDWSRGTVNRQAARIKRMFKWAVSQELIPASIHHALSSVAGLRKGRTEARETSPVLPVDDAVVDATIEQLPKVVGDMITVERLSGMRPAEVCLLRPMDLDRSGDVWIYRLQTHKTEHYGRERVVFFGPRAQAVLLKYLARDAAAYCFRPCDSEAKRRAARHAAREVPLSSGNRPGSNRKARPKCKAGAQYSVAAYRRAIHRGCDRAFPHPALSASPKAKLTAEQLAALKKWQSAHRWSPNQLRHSAATRIRREFGLEASQVILGHASAAVTQVYAERDAAKGIEVARRIG